MSNYFKYLTLLCISLQCLVSCNPLGKHNVQELTDPWLRDRTLVSLKLAGQVGPTIISTDWQDDTKGSIKLKLIVNALDMSAVPVEEISMKDQGQFTAVASVKPGDTIDLSGGTCPIVVTASNGEIRTYVISYEGTNLFEGTFGFVSERSALGWGEETYCYFAGGPDEDVRTGNIYDHKGDVWNAEQNRWPNDEKDNKISFKNTYFDSDEMCQYGSFLNLSGEDGKWADYIFVENYGEESQSYFKDCNSIYRLVPKGKGRWSNKLGSDVLTFYPYDDDTYSRPICSSTILYKGSYKIEYQGATVASWCPGSLSVADFALTRFFTKDEYSYNGDLIATFVADNVRQVWWKMTRISDTCLENHDELIPETPSCE